MKRKLIVAIIVVALLVGCGSVSTTSGSVSTANGSASTTNGSLTTDRSEGRVTYEHISGS